MEIFFTPAALVALGTLVLLEVVLGIDNLVFIAILSEKLPPEQRGKARVIGLGLALLMRLALLSVISWVVTLTAPFFFLWEHPFSGRDLILLAGGLFLLFKATTELHERLEGDSHTFGGSRDYASFWVVVSQIVALDAVFSLDAIITAVGMTQILPVMMAAVIIAMAIMLLAARPLTTFVNAHPTVVVLCLSFLLLIGLSLMAEGFGFSIPKGYLYAAIGFSVLIEFFNQVALHNARKHERRKPIRLRTAEAVLRLMGTSLVNGDPAPAMATASPEQSASSAPAPAFAAEEVDMVSRVLTLSERTARSIMTYRADAAFIDLEDTPATQHRLLVEGTPSVLPVCRGGLDNVVGVAHAADLLGDLVQYGRIRPETLEEPRIVPESTRVLKLMDSLRRSHAHLVLVADEYGSIEGLITFMDLFEAIAGDLPDEGEAPLVQKLAEGRWRIDGTADVHLLEHSLDLHDIASETNDYTSLAGFMLAQLGRLPQQGDSFEHEGFRYTAETVTERRIAFIVVDRLE